MNRKFLILGLVLALCALMAGPAMAFRNTSFTYDSTAGMFEDTYDYFIYSPAYLPEMQKSVLWSQLSNLMSGGDRVLNNSGTSYYLLGGQTDLMGMGKIGAMYDWFGACTPVSARNYNNYPTGTARTSGVNEDTVTSYQDTNSDGILDYRSQSYGRIKVVQNSANEDIYIPYGLGSGNGMDLGVAIKGNWNTYSPTYDSAVADANYGGNQSVSLDEVASVRNTNLVSGQTTYAFDRTHSGTFTYGNSQWALELAARSKNLMPNLDAIVNVGPLLQAYTNSVSYTGTDYTNNLPSTPGMISDRTVTDKRTGAEQSVANLPASGIGFFANVRGDYTLSPALVLTGKLGYTASNASLSSAKLDVAHQDTTRLSTGFSTYTNDINNDSTYAYDGKYTTSNPAASVRLQYLAKGWKLGLGANFDANLTYNDINTVYKLNNVTTISGQPDPTLDSVATRTTGSEYETKTDNITTNIELPIGVVLNVVDNLPIRFGAKHTISHVQSSSTTQYKNLTPDTTTTVLGDGSVTNTVATSSTTDSNYSNYTVTHSNTFYYGVSWWPFKDVQIDITGFSTVLTLSNYNLSFNFYF